MKNAICLLLIAFLVACNSEPEKKIKEIRVFESQIVSGKETNRRMVEKKIYNQKGLLTSEIYFDADGEIESQDNYEYDSKGREVMDFDLSHGKLSFYSKTSYDTRDSITKYTLYKPNKQLDFTIHVKYNKVGINDKDLSINADGSVRFWDEYRYDHFGNQKQWIRYNPDSTIEAKVVYEYDKQNHDIKHTCSGGLGGTYLFKYNKNGLKIEEKAWNTGDKQFLWLKVYSYDKSNRLSKIVEYNDPKHRLKNPYRVFRYEYGFW